MEKHVLTVKTDKKNQLKDITHLIKRIVDDSEVKNGLVIIFAPHTTAAITINENTDVDVQRDFLMGLKHASPDNPNYQHFEGNSDAHIKSSLIGASELIVLHNKELDLGIWQGVYFCEFDGPRSRKVIITIMKEA